MGGSWGEGTHTWSYRCLKVQKRESDPLELDLQAAVFIIVVTLFYSVLLVTS